MKCVAQHQAHRPQKDSENIVLCFGENNPRQEGAVGLEEQFGSDRVKMEPAAPSPGDKVGGNTVQVPSLVTSEFMRCWTL